MQINLHNDIVFKWIFGRQEHTVPLISLLNAATGIPGKFSDVRILNPFDLSEPLTNEKQGILDIRGKDTDTDEWFDLEVQVVGSVFYPQRSKYYLAGMYREQLKKNAEVNYHKLRPCYGIHILVDTIFDEEADESFWYNHFTMLNSRSHKPLADHWHLYYIELKKFKNCFRKRSSSIPGTALEEWSYFLASGQDNTKPLDSRLSHNSAIQEVHKMLQTFTKNDKLREQYRLHEEFLRVQSTDRAVNKELNKAYLLIQKAHKRGKKEKEAALKAKEVATKDKNNALKAQEKEKREKEQLQRNSVKFMQKQGSSVEEIAEILNIPIEDVERCQV